MDGGDAQSILGTGSPSDVSLQPSPAHLHPPQAMLRTINALTLATCDMRGSCAFYEKLGLIRTFETPAFVTLSMSAPVTADNNRLHVNLQLDERFRASAPGESLGWGRAVVFVDDVDALHASLAARGVAAPLPKDAPWGERYFHILDPMGHELSLATPDYSHPRWTRGVQGARERR